MRPLVNPIRFRAHKRRSDDHALADEDDVQAEVVSEETPAPGPGQQVQFFQRIVILIARMDVRPRLRGLRQEQPEIITMLIKHPLSPNEFP